MTTANIYLRFDGDCEEAFLFYQSVLGGEIPRINRFKDMPNCPEGMGEYVMHINLPVGQGETILMGNDSLKGFGSVENQGNNYAVCLNMDDESEADRLFKGLSEGGRIAVPLEKTFWGAYYGDFTDKFGIHWMVNCNS